MSLVLQHRTEVRFSARVGWVRASRAASDRSARWPNRHVRSAAPFLMIEGSQIPTDRGQAAACATSGAMSANIGSLALPVRAHGLLACHLTPPACGRQLEPRSEEHTSELQ